MDKKDLIALAVMSPKVAEKIMDDDYWKSIFQKKNKSMDFTEEDEN